MTLRQIGDKNWTNKGGYGYLEVYEKLWAEYKEAPINLLEIGIYNGNSMRTWCEWFPNATIIGIDHNPNNPMTTDRAELHFGWQEDDEFLLKVATQYEFFDIIIDDGSHIWKDQQGTFETLWPFVETGGMYIIEDLHTSLDTFYQKEDEENTVEYLKTLAEDIIHGRAAEMHSIEFYKSLAVVHKK